MSIWSIRRTRLACVFLVTVVAWSVGDRAHAQQLTLFPFTHNIGDGFTSDQDGLSNRQVLRTTPVLVPNNPNNSTTFSPLTFEGRVIGSYTPPSRAFGGSVSMTITDAVIKNPSASSVGLGSSPSNSTNYADMLVFAFLLHGPLKGPGAISITLDGRLEGTTGGPANVTPTSGRQTLHLGASDTSFIPFPGNSDFAFAEFIRMSPNGTTVPEPFLVTGSTLGPGSTIGVFNGTNALFNLHIADALTLLPGDELVLPNSIEIFAVGSPIPEPSGMLLLAVGVLIAAARSRKQR